MGASLVAFKVKLGGIDKTDAGLDRLRLEFHLPEPYPASYSVSQKDNSILLLVENFFKGETTNPSVPVETAPLSIPAGSASTGKEATKNSSSDAAAPGGQPIDLPTVTPAIKNPSASAGAPPTGGGFPPVGTNGGEPITVDFYKVDLHNVFRLLGEVSHYNIIVAEGVSGTLTLSLREVPWDFVLDVILNLKDLAKEQRFNTIVIYQKNKEFVWPQRSSAEDRLIMEPTGGGKKGPIVIDGGGTEHVQSNEIIEAKKLVTLGINAEKEGNLETAVQLYGKGLDVWPDKIEKKEKSQLANKIASIYLSKLNQNAKAVYYAKKALAADKKNSGAALNAAIGHANMEEASQAQQYFDQ
ncbi:hypothetical protein VU07_01660, partial [Desulfobulbus sp. F4]|nr:hypothetical protein [Desulfobulbus sp. F4]